MESGGFVKSLCDKYQRSVRLSEEESKTDPDSEPFRSKYSARELLNEIKGLLGQLEEGRVEQPCNPYPADSPAGVLAVRLAVIELQLGVNHTETEELSAGEEHLVNSVRLLEPYRLSQEAVSAYLQAQVKETVALELSYVNSNLQLLKEELEELNSSVDVYQNDSETISVPMIPLGLKETKELDLMDPLKSHGVQLQNHTSETELYIAAIEALISEHFGEDGCFYEKEIKDFMNLRQAMRTPSRNESGLELLMEYYNQLYFLDYRFFPLNKTMAVFFHWYDSLTGVPACQRALAFEKGSVLFNTGALYTQIAARQDRSTLKGVDNTVDAFQKAAGAFNYLKENFSNAPSLDMSAASLNMLVQLMIAQVQECVFEKVTLVDSHRNFQAQLQIAQEAARVEEAYSLVYQMMTQPPVKDYVPFSWTTMVHVKSEHFKALSHYYAAIAFCDYNLEFEAEVPEHEKAFLQFHVNAPEGPTLDLTLQDPEERRKLGKAHLKRAIMRHEEAMRIHGLCKILRKMDILQEVLSSAHKRSLSKYSDIDDEEDFFETGDAPDIHPKTHQKPEIQTPNVSKVKVTDIFHRLGPLSVFSIKNKWKPARRAHLVRGENGFGFTLRGDSPVLIAGVVPGGCAEDAGLKEGDYIVSVNGEDCKWSKHAEVVQLLKSVGDEGVDITVITLQNIDAHNMADKKSLLLKHNKENSRKSIMNSKSASTLLVGSKKSSSGKRSKSSGTLGLPFTAAGNKAP